MGANDLSSYRYAAGGCVGFFPLFIALVGWYLPRWRRGFLVAYRKSDPTRVRAWNWRTGIVALLLVMVILGFFLVYLEVAEGEALMSADFFTGLLDGLIIGMVFAGVIVALLMAVRRTFMVVRGVARYDPRERLSSTQARRMAEEEIAALEAHLSAGRNEEPGRERAAEYLELSRRLFLAARPGLAVFDNVDGTGAVEAVSAVVLCRVARSALEKGELLAEEQTLCFINPLHGLSQGTHTFSLGGRDPRRAYPLCQTCLGHALAEPHEELVKRMLTVPVRLGSHPSGDFTTTVFTRGDTRPIELFRSAKDVLEFAARQRGH